MSRSKKPLLQLIFIIKLNCFLKVISLNNQQKNCILDNLDHNLFVPGWCHDQVDSLDYLDLWLMYLLGFVFLKELSYTQNNLVYDIILWSQQPIKTKFLLFDKDGTLHWNDWCIINAKWLLDWKDFLTSIRVMNHWTVVPNKRSKSTDIFLVLYCQL